MDERQQELLTLYNIIKSNGQYELQHNYYIDGERIVPVIPFESRDNHNCNICSYFTRMDQYDGYCDIFNKLLDLPEHSYVWSSNIINCAAYNENKVEKMNIIKSLDEMIEFIEKTANFFDSPEAYEEYYGFQRKWNEETGELLESTRMYYNRGGVFTNIPSKYPCVIRFDWNCEDDLEWIYIG